MSPTPVPEDLVAELRSGSRFLLASHLRPDGDAIGSEVGLARVLRRLDKGATIWNRDATPAVYRRLPGTDAIHVGSEPPAGFPESYTAVVVLECPSLDRTGLEEHLDALPLLNLDHHLGNEHYGKVDWIDPGAPAVGEMVHRLAGELRLELDAETADALYLTLVTDTGGFRFSNATAQAFEAAAQLVREGASPEKVAEWVYESRPESVIRLVGEMLPTLRLHDDGRVASAWLTREMFERVGAAEGDAEGLIDYPRSIAGVRAVALFREAENGKTRVSLRSRGEVDVERIARRHGGGGHHNAAGCTLEGDREEAAEEIVRALTEAVR